MAFTLDVVHVESIKDTYHSLHVGELVKTGAALRMLNWRSWWWILNWFRRLIYPFLTVSSRSKAGSSCSSPTSEKVSSFYVVHDNKSQLLFFIFGLLSFSLCPLHLCDWSVSSAPLKTGQRALIWIKHLGGVFIEEFCVQRPTTRLNSGVELSWVRDWRRIYVVMKNISTANKILAAAFVDFNFCETSRYFFNRIKSWRLFVNEHVHLLG